MSNSSKPLFNSLSLMSSEPSRASGMQHLSVFNYFLWDSLPCHSYPFCKFPCWCFLDCTRGKAFRQQLKLIFFSLKIFKWAVGCHTERSPFFAHATRYNKQVGSCAYNDKYITTTIWPTAFVRCINCKTP